jgi:hypothetical protein
MEVRMPGRPVTINEAIDKIGSFSRQDAIDLIASSQGVPTWTGQAGHPLEHCEITYNAWPNVRFHGSPGVPLLGLGGGAGDAVLLRPDELARDLGKGRHTLSWTDEHLILAVRDLFLGNGAFMALHNLKTAGVNSRLVFKKPTSHTTIATVATSVKPPGSARVATSSVNPLSQSYKAVLDLCTPDRLHLQTIFAEADNSEDVEILVRHGNTVMFQTRFPAFRL